MRKRNEEDELMMRGEEEMVTRDEEVNFHRRLEKERTKT